MRSLSVAVSSALVMASVGSVMPAATAAPAPQSANLAVVVIVQNMGPASSPSSILDYAVFVDNLGPDAAVNVDVNAIIPAGLTLLSAPDPVPHAPGVSAYLDGRVIVLKDAHLPYGPLAVNATAYVTTFVGPQSGMKSAVFGAVTESSTPDPNLSNNVAIKIDKF